MESVNPLFSKSELAQAVKGGVETLAVYMALCKSLSAPRSWIQEIQENLDMVNTMERSHVGGAAGGGGGGGATVLSDEDAVHAAAREREADLSANLARLSTAFDAIGDDDGKFGASSIAPPTDVDALSDDFGGFGALSSISHPAAVAFEEHLQTVQTQLESVLQGREKEIKDMREQFESGLKEKDNQMQKLQSALNEKGQKWMQLSSALKQKDQQMQELSSALKEKGQQMQELSCALKEKDQLIQELESAMKQYEEKFLKVISSGLDKM